MDRRAFLRQATVTATAAIPFMALLERTASARGRQGVANATAGYGPLIPTADQTTGLPLLMLPAGFRYVSFGWGRDRMDDGHTTPRWHDGMAAFPFGSGRVRLVRNHEIGNGRPFSTAAYNPAAGGGTTTLEFDTQAGAVVSMQGSLAGTFRNCAGGRTPWGTWLTCEETVEYHQGVPHGYVFEVPIDGTADPTPLRAMGRFKHEATAVDPATGYVYETEDASNSGFYRFVPDTPGDLSDGGGLFAMKVRGANRVNLGTSRTNGETFDVEWVPIARPNREGTTDTDYVFQQGRTLGAARFARLEGCVYGDDRQIYIVSTSGGIGAGQIWQYSPDAETIRLLFESPGASVLDSPDNIAVSPRGGLVLCEDGTGVENIQGLTVSGQLFPFVTNNVILNGERNDFVGDYRDSEFAGVCFSPDGTWLFANIQKPGITVAITGPWQEGLL